MADDLETAIEDAATAPKSATVDGQNVTQHSLPDQIAADKYLTQKNAAKNHPLGGIKFAKIAPPGTV